MTAAAAVPLLPAVPVNLRKGPQASAFGGGGFPQRLGGQLPSGTMMPLSDGASRAMILKRVQSCCIEEAMSRT